MAVEADGGSDRGPNYVVLGLVAAVALGFFIGQWLMVSALGGRMDSLESNLLEQCSKCQPGAEAPGAAPAKPKATAVETAAPAEPPPVETAAPETSAAPTAAATAAAVPGPAPAPAPVAPPADDY